MFTPGATENQDIVEEHKNEVADEVIQYLVHQGLECSRCISEAERHHQELKMAVMCAKRCFLNIGVVHPLLMVPAAQINLGEEAATAKFVESLFDDRNGKHVADGVGVQGTVVDVEPP